MPQAVLWDCDGVLQHGMAGALEEMAAIVGPQGLPVLFEAELPALRGEQTLADCVAEVIERLGLDLVPGDVLPLWDRYQLDDEALAVLAAVRATGIRCFLATNQQDYRRDRMRTVSGYDDLVDGSFYSCEMGVAKPDPQFFGRILADLDLPAASALFIDDLQGNVDAARSCGLTAARHDPANGAQGLRHILAEHGVQVDLIST